MPCREAVRASGQSDNVPVLIKMLKDLGEHVDGRSTHVQDVCWSLPAPGGEIDAASSVASEEGTSAVSHSFATPGSEDATGN